MASETRHNYGFVLVIAIDIILIIAMGFAMRSCFAKYERNTSAEQATTTTTDTVYIHTVDTVTIREPHFTACTFLRTDTVQLISTTTDTVRVQLPIQQRTYQDSTYTAWISGYEPRLDSIEVYQQLSTVTITNTITKPAKRWSVSASAGMAATPKGVQPYIGVGIGYSIIRF
jgi:opacity protein-like surface antigen